MVGDRNFQGCIDRLRTRICEKHMVKIPPRHHVDQAFCQFKRPRMPHLERGGKIEGCHLFLNRFDNFWATMTRIHTPQPRCAVENLTTIMSGIVHIFGGYQ